MNSQNILSFKVDRSKFKVVRELNAGGTNLYMLFLPIHFGENSNCFGL